MVHYESTKQLTIEEFKTSFQQKLLANNKWVRLSKVVPWDRFAKIYMQMMDRKMGRPGLSPRIVLGALIIKHMKKLDDRGTIEEIQENLYMQYFIGLKEFTIKPVFDPSLFVEIRKRIGKESFDELNELLIKSATGEEDKKHKDKPKNRNKDGGIKNKGKMQADATVADQYIKYPTDTGLLNESRKKLEGMIDNLYEKNGKEGVKPRTYRRNLDKVYLRYSKKRQKTRQEIRKINRKMLESVSRNLRHVDRMLDEQKGERLPLSNRELRYLWVIHTVYKQQREMYENKRQSVNDRIVNLHQPHIRPIVRGKEKVKTEFGAKLGVSLDNGFARLDNISWDAYNESGDLKSQVEGYKALHGFYPELVQVDKIYATRANREWLKDIGTRITASPLGRPSKQKSTSYYEKRKRKKEATERNHIEGKFGQGKNGYELNKIRARLRETSESWISCIFFVMNLLKYEKEYFLLYFYQLILAIKNKIFTKIFYQNKILLVLTT